MAPAGETTVSAPSELGFSVSAQKVHLDVDFANRIVTGETVVTIQPHHKELRTLRLNCRQCDIKNVQVEGKGAIFEYEDPYEKLHLWNSATVHQWHLLRDKVKPHTGAAAEEELVVHLPPTVKIRDVDPRSSAGQEILSRPFGGNALQNGSLESPTLLDTPVTASAPNTAGLPPDLPTLSYRPLKLSITYEIKSPQDGIHFVGLQDGDMRYPHFYTLNSPYAKNACCLFPCVDNSAARSMWEISVRCPRTIGDMYRSVSPAKSNGVDGSAPDGRSIHTNGTSDANETAGHAPERRYSLTEEDTLEMAVVCSGDLTDDIVDPSDPSRKTVSFLCSTPVAAQHVGIAIGPFDHVNLSDYRETETDDKLGQSAVRVHGFCLPRRAHELRNTCITTAMAIDFFTTKYGSYPFPSYKLCFVDDNPEDVAHTACLSICSNRLLIPPDILDPMFSVTRKLTHALASQWIGVNIVPRGPIDVWTVAGISYYITDVFLQKLHGNNEYRYMQKMASNKLVQLDVNRPSLATLGSVLHLDPSEMEFMALKAGLILFILDRRLTKASGSSGMSRIVNRVFLNARTGELPNGCITHTYFARTCEKLGHAKLDNFFAQWVQGAGCPQFQVSQRFNKKKLVIEMTIRQTQNERDTGQKLQPKTFRREVKEDIYAVYAGTPQAVFQGPMTIRIHEADGTPYEHIVEIKEALTKFEIPYNTKYKRLKRSKRAKERAAAAGTLDANVETTDDVLLYCLGDTLQSEEELAQWKLVDWSKDEEERMGQESYEWIRMDADFEWICSTTINMPPYMFVSQLQQDRDVVAQYESIEYMNSQKGHPLISTFLIRTLMDNRYFHAIRTAAACGLAKCATEELDWIGLFHLGKAFQEMYCYRDSPMTLPNDFENIDSYFIQCAIPRAMAKIRDNKGKTPQEVKRFFIDKLKFNDNTNNEYSDCYYVSTLMQSLAEAIISKDVGSGFSLSFGDEETEEEHEMNEVFVKEAINEIERFRRIDEYIPSYQNVYTVTALSCLQRLAEAGVIETKTLDFLRYARMGNADEVRLKAWACLTELGLLSNTAVLKYFLYSLETEPSPYMRDNMLQVFWISLAYIALGTGTRKTQPQQDGFVIDAEAQTKALQASFARTATVSGAIEALKGELKDDSILRECLWSTLNSIYLGLADLVDLLDICSLIYEPITTLVVTLRYPRYWKAKSLGQGKVLFQQTGRVRTKKIQRTYIWNAAAPPASSSSMAAPPPPKPSINRKRSLQIKFSQGQNNKSVAGGSGNNTPVSATQPPLPRLKFKPRADPLAHAQSTPKNAVVSQTAGLMSPPAPPYGGAGSPSMEGTAQGGKPKLKLKFGARSPTT